MACYALEWHATHWNDTPRTRTTCHKTFGFCNLSNLGVPIAGHVLTGASSEASLLYLQEVTATSFLSGHFLSPTNDPFIYSCALSSADQRLFFQKYQFPLIEHRLSRQKPSSPCLTSFVPSLNRLFSPKAGFRWMGIAQTELLRDLVRDCCWWIACLRI
jgi:hypothetical protein